MGLGDFIKKVTGIEAIQNTVDSLSGKSAIESANRANQQAAEKQLRLLERIYNQNREDLAPFRELEQQRGEIGIENLNRLAQLLENPESITSTPGYQFRLQQGMDAATNRASALGGGLSGNQLRAAQEFGQGLATNELNQQFNRLASLSQGVNPVTASNLAGLGQNYAQSAGGVYGNMGRSNASSYLGVHQGRMNLLGQGLRGIGGAIGGGFL